jgi:hypothetical protein
VMSDKRVSEEIRFFLSLITHHSSLR